MFQSARLKLTAWYLVIIMFVSFAFSVVIYRGLTAEVERFARAQRLRIERGIRTRVSPNGVLFEIPEPATDLDLVKETKTRIIIILTIINGTIFVVSGVLGYLLAGKTLRPIHEMVEEQNRFITDASHELRTPLTSLKSAMEVHLRDKKLTLSEAKLLIENNIQDVNKLQALSDSLLQLAQYQKPNGNEHMEKVDLNRCIMDAKHKIEPLLKKKMITVEYKEESFVVYGNQYGLVDLLVILLDNAIKYSPQKTKISITMQRLDGHVRLRIADQGSGIDRKDIPHLFDRFYRSSSARSNSAVLGYGLGLSIAKKIVDRHKGKIYVQSSVNKGTLFTIELPVQQVR